MMVQYGIAILVAAVAILASWMLSKARPRFDEIADDIQSGIDRSGRGLLMAVMRLRDHLNGELLGEIRSRQPRLIATNVVDAVHKKAESIRNRVNVLDGLAKELREQRTAISTMLEFAKGPKSERPELYKAVGLVLFTPVVMVVNTFILMEFFSAVLPTGPILPYPWPPIEIGDVLAVLFATVEVAAGFVIHASDDKGRGATRIFEYAPYLMIAVLCLVETVAYAVISVNVDMPTRLGISAENGLLYASTLYFLAPFGLALTCLLSALGYYLGEHFGRIVAARGLRRAERLAKGGKKLAETLETLPDRVAEDLLKLEPGVRTVLFGDDVKKGLEHLDAQLARSSSSAQAWGSILLDLVLIAGLVLLGYATYAFGMYQFSVWLPPSQSALARVLAIGLALVVGVLGFIAKRRLSGALGIGQGLDAIPIALKMAGLAVLWSGVLVYLIVGAVIRVAVNLVVVALWLAAWPGDVLRRVRRRPAQPEPSRSS